MVKNAEEYPIDFVIPWVDGNDKEWQLIKGKYDKEISCSYKQGEERYRDWENLNYWFRSIEKYAPWVNKIHFITSGHVPLWLNVNNSKIHVVNHKDYMPEKYLPTFSSHPIELNMHKIVGLAEHFVYFNDDTFLIDYIKKKDFFIKGLPCAMIKISCLNNYDLEDDFCHIDFNNMGIINRNFQLDKWKQLNKLFSLHYDFKTNIRNLVLLLSFVYPGFLPAHLPMPFCKSILEEVWKKEYDYLDSVSIHKFREIKDVNQWLFQYWQLVKGNFMPTNIYKRAKLYEIGRDDEDIFSAILNHKFKMICINDTKIDMNFEIEKEKLKTIFQITLHDKCSFEI